MLTALIQDTMGVAAKDYEETAWAKRKRGPEDEEISAKRVKRLPFSLKRPLLKIADFHWAIVLDTTGKKRQMWLPAGDGNSRRQKYQDRIDTIVRMWVQDDSIFHGCVLYSNYTVTKYDRSVWWSLIREKWCYVDIILQTPDGRVIVIAVDEHQHKSKSYPRLKERLREVLIASAIRAPITIYRINPNRYKTKNQQGPYSRADVDTKMAALKHELEGLISGQIWNVEKTPWQVIFRYYDDSDVRTANYRLELENLVRENMAEFDKPDYRKVLLEMGIDYALI